MSKLAFIFPGQGAQKAGMGKDFYENSEAARSFFDQAQKILDFDLKEMCFGEHEELNLTEYTQPCMVSVCLAIVQELKKRGINPDITAGLSLGEYAAVAPFFSRSRYCFVIENIVAEAAKLLEKGACYE